MSYHSDQSIDRNRPNGAPVFSGAHTTSENVTGEVGVANEVTQSRAESLLRTSDENRQRQHAHEQFLRHQQELRQRQEYIRQTIMAQVADVVMAADFPVPEDTLGGVQIEALKRTIISTANLDPTPLPPPTSLEVPQLHLTEREVSELPLDRRRLLASRALDALRRLCPTNSAPANYCDVDNLDTPPEEHRTSAFTDLSGWQNEGKVDDGKNIDAKSEKGKGLTLPRLNAANVNLPQLRHALAQRPASAGVLPPGALFNPITNSPHFNRQPPPYLPPPPNSPAMPNRNIRPPNNANLKVLVTVKAHVITQF